MPVRVICSDALQAASEAAVGGDPSLTNCGEVRSGSPPTATTEAVAWIAGDSILPSKPSIGWAFGSSAAAARRSGAAAGCGGPGRSAVTEWASPRPVARRLEVKVPTGSTERDAVPAGASMVAVSSYQQACFRGSGVVRSRGPSSVATQRQGRPSGSRPRDQPATDASSRWAITDWRAGAGAGRADRHGDRQRGLELVERQRGGVAVGADRGDLFDALALDRLEAVDRLGAALDAEAGDLQRVEADELGAPGRGGRGHVEIDRLAAFGADRVEVADRPRWDEHITRGPAHSAPRVKAP